MPVTHKTIIFYFSPGMCCVLDASMTITLQGAICWRDEISPTCVCSKGLWNTGPILLLLLLLLLLRRLVYLLVESLSPCSMSDMFVVESKLTRPELNKLCYLSWQMVFLLNPSLFPSFANDVGVCEYISVCAYVHVWVCKHVCLCVHEIHMLDLYVANTLSSKVLLQCCF